MADFRFYIIGALEKTGTASPSPGEYTFINFNQIKVPQAQIMTMKREVCLGHTIRSPHPLKLEVWHGSNVVTGLMGLMSPGMPPNNVASVMTKLIPVSSEMIDNNLPGYYLDVGWLFLKGSGPVADTEYVSAGAEGSEIAIHIVGQTTKIYFLGGTAGEKGWYKIRDVSAKQEVDYPDKLIEVDTSTTPPTVSGPNPLPTADSFLAELQKLRTRAGI